MANIQKSACIILRSIRWQESSKIVTVYAREWGKTGIIAKGALRPKSPFAGKLESLNLTEAIISFKESRQLQILTDLQVWHPFNQLRMQPDHLPYALAILELLDGTLEEHQPDAVFFDFCAAMLQSLERAKRPEVVFWYFILKLTSFLGFRPQLQMCTSCQAETSSGPVTFNLSSGAIFCAACSSNSAGGVRLSDTEWEFLKRLQTFPHRQIGQFPQQFQSSHRYTTLLLDYLNLHRETRLQLRSLELL